MQFDEEIREFLIESNENLNALDQQIVELEKDPGDKELIASVFRTIHTIKGTSGFFGFNILGSITHIAESILGQVREKQRPLTPALVSLILETVDAVKQILLAIAANKQEGADCYQPLRDRLDVEYQRYGEDGSAQASPVEMPVVNLEQNIRQETAVAAEITSRGGRRAGDTATEEGSPCALPDAITMQPRYERRGVRKDSSVDERDSGAEFRTKGSEQPRGRRADDTTTGPTIRVDVTLLDKLMNQVGELALVRNQISQCAQQSNKANTAARKLDLITHELQESVMLMRMQPIGVVWNKLPRVVRDLSVEMGKSVEIQMEGASTELDKTIIEAITDPLTHIVRNACDHGIEAPEVRVASGKSAHGTILLRAFNEGGYAHIEVSDDGAGIDLEKIKSKAVQRALIRPERAATMPEWDALRLIFLPGLSTVDKVTSFSGRGVGMDVVKTNIEKIHGTIDITNRAGLGVTLKIKIPLTLPILPGQVVSSTVMGRTPQTTLL